MGWSNHPDVLDQPDPSHPVVALAWLPSPTTQQWSLASGDFHHPTPVHVLPGGTLIRPLALQCSSPISPPISLQTPASSENTGEKISKYHKTPGEDRGLTVVSITVVNDPEWKIGEWVESEAGSRTAHSETRLRGTQTACSVDDVRPGEGFAKAGHRGAWQRCNPPGIGCPTVIA